jgi:hypothetical protein
MVHPGSRLSLWTAALILFLAGTAFAQGGFRVNEAEVRIQTQTKGIFLALVVELPVENLNPQTTPARVSVELINPRGRTKSHAEQDVSLRPGATTLKFPLPQEDAWLTLNEDDGLLWCRLHYSIAPSLSGPAPAKTVEGLVSVSEVTPQLFELHVDGPAQIRAGGHSALRVRAIHPVTAKPVARVTVQASLDIGANDREPLLTRKAATDREGLATLEFNLPEHIVADDNEIDVKVTGTLGGFSADADGELRVRTIGTTILFAAGVKPARPS